MVENQEKQNRDSDIKRANDVTRGPRHKMRGVHCTLPIRPRMRNLLEHILALPRNLIVIIITGYQRTLSPDHGPLKALYPYGYCRHSPTCSMYAKKVIGERGVIIGGLLSIKRLLTCYPWKKLSDEKIRDLMDLP